MAIAQLIQREYQGRRDLSGLGGVETGRDAAEFLLLGANSVQARPNPSHAPDLHHSPVEDLLGLRGVETGRDAADFLLLGANTCLSPESTLNQHLFKSQQPWSLMKRIWIVRGLPQSCGQTWFLFAQVCTGVMLHGYPLVKSLCGDLQVRSWPV